MPSKWSVDLAKASQALTNVGEKTLPKPPGYEIVSEMDNEEPSAVVTAEQQLATKQRQVMSLAYSPGKGLLTTGFMLWMSGSSIQVFSIMMTGMALINPIKAIVGVNETFKKFANEEGVDTRLPKLIFIVLQILALAVGLYKTYTMNLLPVTSADWTSFLPEKECLESSTVPL